MRFVYIFRIDNDVLIDNMEGLYVKLQLFGMRLLAFWGKYKLKGL